MEQLESLQRVNRQQRLAEWGRRVEACRNSGLTVVQWCQENGIAVSTYFSWQRKVFQALKEVQEVTFAEVCIFRPSESKETVGVSPPSREKQVQVHGRESTGVLFGKKWQRNASQSAPPRVIYSDWNPFLLRMESSPSMRIL